MNAPAPYLIGIAGPSCGGKTVLARRVAELLGDGRVARFALDAYYCDLSAISPELRERHNFDEPGALDWPLMRRDLGRVALGQTIEAPVYDFTQHARASGIEPIAPADFILVEGLFALYDMDIRAMLGFTVFVDAPDGVCLERRLRRDTRSRGRTEAAVLEQYAATVRPMAERYVRPTRVHADLVVNGCAPLETSARRVVELVKQRLRLGPSAVKEV